MRIGAAVLVGALALGGCAKSREAPPAPAATAMAKGGGDVSRDPAAPADGAKAGEQTGMPKTARKVIRNAELSIEVASPAAAETTVTSLVERLGGYVASSERESGADEGESSESRVRLSLRVPAEKMGEALREIKRLGRGAETEKIGSEDVTDEFIDVQARIDNQKHLEQSLVGILAQANSVDSALKVHQELASVRTEIDRLEGRKRFLETESDLAKISLSLAPVRQVVATSPTTGFGVTLRRAMADSVDVSIAMVTFAIRAIGVMLPVAVLFGLPLAALVWWLKRRQRRLVAALAAQG
ncbi:MAG TPA: DUF4349 domain-containing protein [Polyangiaceae bacterium]|nr:DUF4349 domain-containing protein [Polyangiaceae bacterium]